ncbi:MAG TPA: S-adenosylmethionine:tRNA ribosyltransferase-isomerase [Polyangiaceae bacterium]|jgi:S-adenosylmethionine:tRNA ribosyltransferase-isomerase|nr:S-adenosylmethionine:tRNA ribosyltransferase-isomerase [Polyangiaceae bacterium]
MIPSHVFAPATRARPIAETRLLVLRANTGEKAEASFDDLARLLAPSDVVVVNDAATIPGSVFGATRDGAPFELRLLSLPDARGEADAAVLGAGDWHTPTEKRAAPPSLARGASLVVSGLTARVVRVDGARRVRVAFEGDRDDAVSRLYRAGKPVQYAHITEPLPLWEVQNVYAAEPWAAEMPSAGRPLDFAALDALRKRGIAVVRLTHGAGLSSIGDGALDASLPWVERYRIPRETADTVNAATRVIAVGTSVVRALESSARVHGEVRAEEATTDLRIDRSRRLRAVHGLLTGMHDATTSHADLLAAFVSPVRLTEASEWAASRGFLGHELGDSCLILPS